MSSVMPVTGPVWELPAMFLDTTLGGTLGYIFLYVVLDITSPGYKHTDGTERFMYLTTYAQEISVTARLFDFDYGPGLSWDSIKGVSPAIWAILTLITSSAVNMLPVKVRVFFQLSWTPANAFVHTVVWGARILDGLPENPRFGHNYSGTSAHKSPTELWR